MDLSGKIALVTGGARRVGKAISLALAKAGARVAIHYGHSQTEAEALAGEIRRMEGQADLFRADLAKAEEVEALFAAIRSSLGRLDALVNNAAVYPRTPLAELTAEQWDEVQAVNSRAAALCIRLAAELMPAAGGAIVNITDSAVGRGLSGYPAYAASKGALLALTRTAARALAPRNIRVNAVAPGIALWPEGVTEKQKARVLAKVPMKRAGSPEDVAAAVAFLLQQDYITGQELRVDGGWNMG